MRAQRLVVALLLGTGCLSTGGVVQHGELPPGPTAEEQLREILDWAAADGSPTAIEVRKNAETRLRRATKSDADREKISRAWTHAQAATRPGLDAQEKERLWAACISELTHGPDG
jgi:hypothetical protein